MANFDIEQLNKYVSSYDPKVHGGNEMKIILEDMLYGIGICMDPKYKGHDGYKKFKHMLINYLKLSSI